MVKFEVFFKESVWKDLKKVPKNNLKKILSGIRELKENPRPMGCEKLFGRERYRVRQGKFRFVYSIQDDELSVRISKVGRRKHIYQQSERVDEKKETEKDEIALPIFLL